MRRLIRMQMLVIMACIMFLIACGDHEHEHEHLVAEHLHVREDVVDLSGHFQIIGQEDGLHDQFLEYANDIIEEVEEFERKRRLGEKVEDVDDEKYLDKIFTLKIKVKWVNMETLEIYADLDKSEDIHLYILFEGHEELVNDTISLGNTYRIKLQIIYFETLIPSITFVCKIII